MAPLQHLHNFLPKLQVTRKMIKQRLQLAAFLNINEGSMVWAFCVHCLMIFLLLRASHRGAWCILNMSGICAIGIMVHLACNLADDDLPQKVYQSPRVNFLMTCMWSLYVIDSWGVLQPQACSTPKLSQITSAKQELGGSTQAIFERWLLMHAIRYFAGNMLIF